MLPALAALIPEIAKKGIDIVGGLFQSDTDKLKAQQQYESEIRALVQSHELAIEGQLTERHKNDMQSDSWLAKNIRPLILIYTTALFTIAMFIQVPQPVLKIMETLLITEYTFYFGGRSMEKIISIVKGNNAS